MKRHNRPAAAAGGGVFGARRAARRAFWLFLAIAVVCSAQVGWWIIFQLREAKRIADLRWGIMGTARELVGMRLADQYIEVWLAVDSLLQVPDWNDIVPRTLASHPAVTRITTTPPIRRVHGMAMMPTPQDEWTWRLPRGDDTIYVVLNADFPRLYLQRQGTPFEFSGRAPRPGRSPWTGPGHPLSPSQREVDQIERERHRSVLMFASEGSFFVVLVILGAYLIYRSVRRSADLGRQQQNFIAAVTHELKAPLASVKLYAETLARPELGREKQDSYLGRMLEDITRLETLIDDILLAGRLEQRGFHVRARPTNLSRDLLEYVEAMRGFLERHRFTLRTRVEPDLMAVTDYDAFRRVVEGIVDNAVKYSGDCKEAELTLERKGDDVVLCVQDFGVGVPAEETERVFDAFYRVGDEMTRKIKGTGLGLYLVREIVAAHGGRVVLESRGNGGGTRVTVTLKGGNEKAHPDR